MCFSVKNLKKLIKKIRPLFEAPISTMTKTILAQSPKVFPKSSYKKHYRAYQEELSKEEKLKKKYNAPTSDLLQRLNFQPYESGDIEWDNDISDLNSPLTGLFAKNKNSVFHPPTYEASQKNDSKLKKETNHFSKNHKLEVNIPKIPENIYPQETQKKLSKFENYPASNKLTTVILEEEECPSTNRTPRIKQMVGKNSIFEIQERRHSIRKLFKKPDEQGNLKIH